MKQTNQSTYQLLGFDQNWICVLHDLIHFNGDHDFNLDVFLNMEMQANASTPTQEVKFDIREIEKIKTDVSIYFGVASPKNKYPIYRDFLHFVKQEDYNNLIADSSILSYSSILEQAVLIDHQCVISAQTSIGFGVSIKRGAKIGHHNKIGAFSDINPGVITSGNVQIGNACEIGSGAIFKNNVIVGDNTFVGMGSVVTKDIPPNSIAFGNPCKVIRKNDIWNIQID
ncbi:hypothetical protein [Marinifilum caeruleilacunae]|uniref:Acetyltransferase n=1 Tax=Marinifilum caeruleilacunae TaxID=2499076 RepID=A0ABX1WQV3_9BACT|nr:hypothetical protein [Marinifilum caeruleilacunae]NOU58464.1 hypothetical protein [Marinifilum caeruleilacunae]